MRNTYASGNGQLTQQVYGNEDTGSFTYDSLGRTIQTDYSNGRALDYTYNGNRSPIYIIEPPYPPVAQSISDDNAAPVGCTVQRTLKSTVTEEHSYIYASGKLLRETITGSGATKDLWLSV